MALAKREFIPEFEADYADAWMGANYPAYGLYCRHVKGLRLRDIEYVLEEPDMRSAAIFADVKDLDVDSIAADAPPSGMPIIRLNQVRRGFIRGCNASHEVKVWLHVQGEQTEKITILGNDLSEAQDPIVTAENVRSAAVYQSGNRMPHQS